MVLIAVVSDFESCTVSPCFTCYEYMCVIYTCCSPGSACCFNLLLSTCCMFISPLFRCLLFVNYYYFTSTIMILLCAIFVGCFAVSILCHGTPAVRWTVPAPDNLFDCLFACCVIVSYQSYMGHLFLVSLHVLIVLIFIPGFFNICCCLDLLVLL